MDEMRYAVRGYLDRDFRTEVELLHRVTPERKFSVEQLRHWHRMLDHPGMVFQPYVVEDRSSGRGVAFASLESAPDSVDPESLWSDILVDPDHERQGIGRFLADTLEVAARGLHLKLLRATGRADRPRSLEFLARRGYVERRRGWQSRLLLPAPGLALVPRRDHEFAREGIEFRTLAEEGPDRAEVRRRLHRLFNAVLQDEPRLGPFTPSTYEQFVTSDLESPGFLPEAYFLARVGEEYIAVSNLERLPAEPGVLHQVLTGTRREYRGRGVATELKRRTVVYAQGHGFRSIRTNNDSLNHPMWAINQKLGYRREMETIFFEKTLEPVGAA